MIGQNSNGVERSSRNHFMFYLLQRVPICLQAVFKQSLSSLQAVFRHFLRSLQAILKLFSSSLQVLFKMSVCLKVTFKHSIKAVFNKALLKSRTFGFINQGIKHFVLLMLNEEQVTLKYLLKRCFFHKNKITNKYQH